MNDQTAAPLGLRDYFPLPTHDEWHAECLRLLKGRPFDRTMLTDTPEGITLRPLYTEADEKQLTHLASMPGTAPFGRGTQTLGYREAPWQVAQELPYPTADELNEALRRDLSRGQTAAVITIDRAGQFGHDPDQAPPEQVGAGGTSLASLVELREALAGVDLASVPVHLESGSAALAYAAFLVALAREQDVEPGRLSGSVGLDPIAGLAEYGRLPLALPRAYDELALLTSWTAAHAPSLKTVAASGHLYHDGGASGVDELALTLSVAVNHLRELEVRGLDVDTVAPRIRFGFSVGTHFFMEIARLRAARLLWARIVAASRGGDEAQRMNIHARTSRFTKTVLDPHVNMLRATTEAMAAIFGGVDSLHVAPFDEPLGLPDRISRRVARNTHTMLREESHLDLVTDPAGGSWCVETLTHEIAQAAWQRFQTIEAKGGIVAALESGAVQAMVKETADARRQRLAHRDDVQVGTNQYPNALEQPLAGRRVDHAALAAERADALQAHRTGGANADNIAVLAKLQDVLDGQEAEVFEALVAAAGAGATVGELSKTFRHDGDPALSVAPIATWRAGEMFEQLRATVRGHGDLAATSIFCANLGDVARYMPRLDFTRGFFQTAGFTVEADRYYADPTEVVEAALQSGARTAVIVGLDTTYQEQAVATARALKEAGVRTVILAGKPKDMIDELNAAGVDVFVHARCDAHLVLTDLARRKGVAL